MNQQPEPPVPYFYGATADEAWVRAAGAVTGALGRPRLGRGGEVREILHSTVRIADPRQRWVLSRRPGINPAFAIAEAFWILSGRDDSQFVNFWNPALPRYAGAGPCYDGAYGKRLRGAFGFDQIEAAIDALSRNPSNRQVVLQIWDPRTDFPGDDGDPASKDVPCNVCAFLKVRDGRLEWSQILRSNDIFRGTPYNIVQFTILQEYIAGSLGLDLGEFVLVADSLHAYQKDLGAFFVDASPMPRSDCRIALPRDLARIALQRSVSMLDWLADGSLTQERFRDIIVGADIPPGHAELVRIAAADSARRRGWRELSIAAADACTDAALRSAWSRWERDRGLAKAGPAGAPERSMAVP